MENSIFYRRKMFYMYYCTNKTLNFITVSYRKLATTAKFLVPAKLIMHKSNWRTVVAKQVARQKKILLHIKRKNIALEATSNS